MIKICGPIPTVIQNPNYDSQLICTLNCRLLVTLQLYAVFRDFRRGSWVWAPLPWLLPFCPLSLIHWLVAPSPFMRVAKPSCRRRCLKCSGWALSSAASGTISFDFLVLIAAFPIAAGPYSNNTLTQPKMWHINNVTCDVHIVICISWIMLHSNVY